jgi:uncharacterized membrane protein
LQAVTLPNPPDSLWDLCFFLTFPDEFPLMATGHVRIKKARKGVVMELLNTISLVIGVVGIAIIIWGAVLALIEFSRLEYGRLRGTETYKKTEVLRYHFGTYILLGLEFLVAADIIHTVIRPDFEGLIILGSIVIIRTIISHFLNREIKHSEDFPPAAT